MLYRMPQGHVIDIVIIGFLQLTVLPFLKSKNNLDIVGIPRDILSLI